MSRATVLVTRPTSSSPNLLGRLASLGFAVRHVPTVSLEATDPGLELVPAMRRLRAGDWLVVTSPFGARMVSAAAHLAWSSAERPRVAALGGGTARAVAEGGLVAEAVAAEATPSALVAAIGAAGAPDSAGAPAAARPLDGSFVLLARSDLADRRLPAALAAAGACVRIVIAYRTVIGPEDSRSAWQRALDDPAAAFIVVASGSAVAGAVGLAGDRSGRLRTLATVAIGPTTAGAARRAGLWVAATADHPDDDGLVEAVLRADATRRADANRRADATRRADDRIDVRRALRPATSGPSLVGHP